jgi:hypothetical protein
MFFLSSIEIFSWGFSPFRNFRIRPVPFVDFYAGPWLPPLFLQLVKVVSTLFWDRDENGTSCWLNDVNTKLPFVIMYIIFSEESFCYYYYSAFSALVGDICTSTSALGLITFFSYSLE